MGTTKDLCGPVKRRDLAELQEGSSEYDEFPYSSMAYSRNIAVPCDRNDNSETTSH